MEVEEREGPWFAHDHDALDSIHLDTSNRGPDVAI
jgi:hypothetical protein